ncbi:acetyl-CoA carboxylase carboxyltransferase subunit alpha/beta [Streptantibioticus rubrisoli]|uniref:Acetyl-coenzyme A carboxylase carboxyl transferase subunits beta/alpha n=1 Tax=Streptantibioticus rubrisoli TaxID=1387313 RepID=A0ABT1P8P2_9ACTN|nr:acetyl-CoA carboxylase carboxyltransferase subunit alpha/beta [Streptantibioticus rubrisoli]MCQ4041741.1 acetyl-CoA carboxylase carboxyltransferase subunit alpha/beta [Streptantibioticus rubrisoli]
MTALHLFKTVLDPGTWHSWDEPVAVPASADPDYRADLERARQRSGLDESVVTGEGRVKGRRVALMACEFGFLGGSIGVAAGERLVRAVERATREGLPLLASPASGGTRMQEGTIAFLQMVKVAAAVADHKAAGLPYLVYLRHPTTGGVLASWGSLGHVTAAEPGALIGFLGPRVHQALYGEEFPHGVQVAENLLAHGLLDAVLPAEQLAGVAARALDVLCGGVETGGGGAHRRAEEAGVSQAGVKQVARSPLRFGSALKGRGELRDQPQWRGRRTTAHRRTPSGAPGVEPGATQSPLPSVPPTAESIRRSRRPERPDLRALLRTAGRAVTPLSGTGAGERDPGLLLALARFGSARCVVLGHDRHGPDGPRLGPAGLREARRGMRIAAELRLPLLTVIDTAGAALSQEAEEGGLAGEIARCLADLVTLPAPTLCLLLGQGAGGGALALLPADRVLAARHAWLSPLPPEGASAILYRTTERAYEVADRQGVRSADLRSHRIVDRIVEETPDAADAPEPFLAELGRVLDAELSALRAMDAAARLAARRARYRSLGLG